MLAGLELPRKTRMLDFQRIYKHRRLSMVVKEPPVLCVGSELHLGGAQGSREGEERWAHQLMRNMPGGPCPHAPPPQAELGHGSKVSVTGSLILSRRSLQRLLVIFFLPSGSSNSLSRVHWESWETLASPDILKPRTTSFVVLMSLIGYYGYTNKSYNFFKS